ncbi:MAG: adenosylcobinamide-phosphate synthase CbiB [Rhodobacteraceae bacterium]|nr:adenosylcobinamide-phosphate synthase CbiB [Paracoccaceae bacterium]
MNLVSLLLALVIDRLFGDPDWLWKRIPHPVRLFGLGIGYVERRCIRCRRPAGIMLVAGGCAGLFAVGRLVAEVPGAAVIEILLASVLLAHRSLVDHVEAVADGLAVDLRSGREAVARIVGRDVSDLDPEGVAKAAVESCAEGFSDGVVAPCFWFAVLGLPGILVYKFVNTADSMIGYRNERYREFGWAAARLDDLLNWIPARIAALLIAVSGSELGGFRQIVRDAGTHDSPNAGWPESAMAHSLDLCLGGPRSYGGATVDLACMNAGGRRNISAADISAAVARIESAHRILVMTLFGLLALSLVSGWVG